MKISDIRCENWMEQFISQIEDKSIHDLVLPATHNSSAYMLKVDSIPEESIWVKVSNLAAKYFVCVEGLIKDWVITQNGSVYEQLKQGIRFLDLRVMWNAETESFACSHTFLTASLDEVLSDVRRFIDEHPSEVVVTKFKSDFAHRKEIEGHEKDLLERISQAWGDCMLQAPHSNTEESSKIKDMLTTNHRIQCFYKAEDNKVQHPSIWDGDNLEEFWIDGSNIDDRLKEIEDGIKSIKEGDGKTYLAPFTLTATKRDIIFGVLKQLSSSKSQNNLQSLVTKMHEILPEYFKQHAEDLKKVQGISLDFPLKRDIQHIISLNLEDF
ncbi:MAG: hypothetical protein CMO81_05635 [Waddliaceae bacterium]|nr:hypothetical protein [Waddliaceae bacterium]